MVTLDKLNEDGLLSYEDKHLLENLALGEENILVIGNDKEMNGLLLMAILKKRLGPADGETWYFKSRDDLDIGLPSVINSKFVKSYIDARELVRPMPFVPIVIDEINTQAIADFFLNCCVGLRNRVTATYTHWGDDKTVLESFAQLTRPTEGVDYRSLDTVVNYVKDMVKVFVIYTEVDGQKKIYTVDNRRQ
ncbi:hypothetical protein NSQ62_14480 [Solibacillus sp. FSL H8-0523]|uniref:hypothetical protein n=1 Tax=Solibacillus sp. FSL H8-0523 TaxID=2954511 RepID=UPI003100D0BA